jgi:hypothetical protein
MNVLRFGRGSPLGVLQKYCYFLSVSKSKMADPVSGWPRHFCQLDISVDISPLTTVVVVSTNDILVLDIL